MLSAPTPASARSRRWATALPLIRTWLSSGSPRIVSGPARRRNDASAAVTDCSANAGSVRNPETVGTEPVRIASSDGSHSRTRGRAPSSRSQRSSSAVMPAA